MKTYLVTIPIAGHITFEVEADSFENAIEKAWQLDSEEGELTYDLLESFGRGNVCHCPTPWEVEAEEV